MNTTVGGSRGYPVDESYPTTWHGFLSPAHLRMVCAWKGVAWQVGPQTPLAIAGLDFGTGCTSLVLSAGKPALAGGRPGLQPGADRRGPQHECSGAPGQSFIEADLDDRALDRLPEFDLITVHGVWSWVSEPVREGVLRLLMRRLKPGGLVVDPASAASRRPQHRGTGSGLCVREASERGPARASRPLELAAARLGRGRGQTK